MRKCLILLFAFTTTSVSGAPAWTWVDANGQVHYADRPVPGAKQVDLPGAQGFGSSARQQAPAAESTGSTSRQAAAAEKPAPVAQRYRAFNVVSPKQQETLWNVGGEVNVQVELDPPLQPGHKLDLYLDGVLRNLSSTSPTLALEEVPRGIHSVQAVVLDQNGGEVVRSLATTFMVQQTSIQNPQRKN